MFSTRNYIFVGLLTGVVVFLVANFAGPGVASWISSVEAQAQAVGMGGLAIFIAQPLIWVMQNPLFGAVAAALFWPFLLIWIALLFIMLLVAFGAEAARDVNRQL
jgi:hypothetical protein